MLQELLFEQELEIKYSQQSLLYKSFWSPITDTNLSISWAAGNYMEQLMHFRGVLDATEDVSSLLFNSNVGILSNHLLKGPKKQISQGRFLTKMPNLPELLF